MRFSGTSAASIAATGAVVVSKPAAKNTTRWPGFALAMSTASMGEATGRTSPPAALACSRLRVSLRGRFTGTRSMSPKLTTITSGSCRAICMAW